MSSSLVSPPCFFARPRAVSNTEVPVPLPCIQTCLRPYRARANVRLQNVRSPIGLAPTCLPGPSRPLLSEPSFRLRAHSSARAAPPRSGPLRTLLGGHTSGFPHLLFLLVHLRAHTMPPCTRQTPACFTSTPACRPHSWPEVRCLERRTLVFSSLEDLDLGHEQRRG